MAKLCENWWLRPCGGREVLGIALPLVISTMSFTVMHFCDRMFLAWYSTSAMAAASMAGSLNWSVFSFPMIGIGMAISTLVGQQIGGGNPRLAARATWTGWWIAMVYTTIFGGLYLLLPGLFVMPHALGSRDFDETRALSILLLRFVAAYCLFDALQIVFVSVLKEAGDTAVVRVATTATASTFVITGNVCNYRYCRRPIRRMGNHGLVVADHRLDPRPGGRLSGAVYSRPMAVHASH